MSVTAGSIITQASLLLQDIPMTRWTEPELLGWLNQGQDQIVALKPDAMSVVASMKLVASKTRQRLPDGTSAYLDELAGTLRAGLKLLDVVRNMGVDGASPGRAVSIVDKTILNLTDPDWHFNTKSNVIQHFMYDEKNPLVFYVYPAAHASVQTWVEVAYIATPTPAESAQHSIDLPDNYAAVLLDYMLFRAFSKSSDSTIHLQKALAYYESFMRILGSYSAAEAGFDPNNLGLTPSPSLRK